MRECMCAYMCVCVCARAGMCVRARARALVALWVLCAMEVECVAGQVWWMALTLRVASLW